MSSLGCFLGGPTAWFFFGPLGTGKRVHCHLAMCRELRLLAVLGLGPERRGAAAFGTLLKGVYFWATLHFYWPGEPLKGREGMEVRDERKEGNRPPAGFLRPWGPKKRGALPLGDVPGASAPC